MPNSNYSATSNDLLTAPATSGQGGDLSGTMIDPKNDNPNAYGPNMNTPAVVTTSNVAQKTNQNIADLTTATASTTKIPVPTYGSEVKDASGRVIGIAKYDPNTGKPLVDPNAATEAARLKAEADKKATTDAAINNAAGLPIDGLPAQPTKSQAEIDAEQGIADTQAQIKVLAEQMDAHSAALMANISAEYDNLINQQKIQNTQYQGGITTEGIVSGRARYAPVMQAGLINTAISSGLAEIAKLQTKKQSLLIQAQQARDDQSYKMLNDTMIQYRETVKNERTLTQNTYDNAMKASQEGRDIARLDLQLRQSDLGQLNAAGYAIVGGNIIPTLTSLKEQRIAETNSVSVQVDSKGVVTGVDKSTGETLWRTEAGVGRSGSASPNILVNSIPDPVSGTPQAIQITDKNTGTVSYVDPVTGKDIPADQVQLKAPQDPLDTLINNMISDVTSTMNTGTAN